MNIFTANIEFFIGAYAGFFIGMLTYKTVSAWWDKFTALPAPRAATNAEIASWMEQGKFDHLLANQVVEKRAPANSRSAS